jgi:hypothetical protein
VILLLGDSVQFANAGDADHVFARLARAAVAPLATVNGNHDLRLGDTFDERAHAHGIRLLHRDPLELRGVALSGVGIERGPTPPQYVGRLGGSADGAALVVASHFPVLSEASRLTAAGLPYPGDLVNRADLERALRADGRPTIVLSGHIHARCSAHDGSLLQLSVGALIEPPFDATVVELDLSGPIVRRTARRLGDVPVTDPVFGPDEDRWHRASGGWELEASGVAA